MILAITVGLIKNSLNNRRFLITLNKRYGCRGAEDWVAQQLGDLFRDPGASYVLFCHLQCVRDTSPWAQERWCPAKKKCSPLLVSFYYQRNPFSEDSPTTLPQEIFSGLSLIRIKSESIMDKKMRPLWCLKPVLMPSLGVGRDRELLPWTYGRENTWTELGLC